MKISNRKIKLNKVIINTQQPQQQLQSKYENIIFK